MLAKRVARIVARSGCGSPRSPLIEAVCSLVRDYPGKSESWISRSVLRMFHVREVGRRRWVVRGFRWLGDTRPFYSVFLTGEGRYVCDCMGRRYGVVRMRSVCTHVGGVILFRRLRLIIEGCFDGK